MNDTSAESRILCGRKPADSVIRNLMELLKASQAQGQALLGRPAPCLAVIVVGDRSDSALYVNIKKKMAEKLGISLRVVKLEEETTAQILQENIEVLNGDDKVDGIIVQVPLPLHLPVSLCQIVDPSKDVDGFNYMNVGKLALTIMVPLFTPCTPRGVMELLEYHNVSLSGKNVVILGRSNVVGRPLSLMMLAENATVTVCHSLTQGVMEHTKRADILVCAMGKARLVKAEWVKDDAVIIDVGVSCIKEEGKNKTVGDVDSRHVLANTSATKITPVPGGVGPMTVAMLMKATVEAFERRIFTAEMKQKE
jgi:5,10-methylene-tetrahydrofolate dehydrogenase/methenyl tetrahydrofolate cyclohydrolase